MPFNWFSNCHKVVIHKMRILSKIAEQLGLAKAEDKILIVDEVKVKADSAEVPEASPANVQHSSTASDSSSSDGQASGESAAEVADAASENTSTNEEVAEGAQPVAETNSGTAEEGSGTQDVEVEDKGTAQGAPSQPTEEQAADVATAATAEEVVFLYNAAHVSATTEVLEFTESELMQSDGNALVGMVAKSAGLTLSDGRLLSAQGITAGVLAGVVGNILERQRLELAALYEKYEERLKDLESKYETISTENKTLKNWKVEHETIVSLSRGDFSEEDMQPEKPFSATTQEAIAAYNKGKK
jgi:hypothetical protein